MRSIRKTFKAKQSPATDALPLDEAETTSFANASARAFEHAAGSVQTDTPNSPSTSLGGTPTSSLRDEENDDLTIYAAEATDKDMNQSPDRKSALLGGFMMVLSGFIFSVVSVLFHWGGQLGYDSSELLVFRAVPQVLLTVFFLFINVEKGCNMTWQWPKIKADLAVMTKRLWFFVVMRGLVGAFGALNYTYAIQALDLGDAVAIVSLYPILTAFVARIFLKEQITVRHFVGLVISCVGVLLIAQPAFLFGQDSSTDSSTDSSSGSSSDDSYGSSTLGDSSTLDTDDSDSTLTGDDSVDSSSRGEVNTFPVVGYACALTSSLCGGFIFTFIRAAKGANHMFLVMSHGVFSVLESVFCVAVGLQKFRTDGIFEDVNYVIWIIIVVMGAVGFLGQFTQNKAGQMIDAGIGSLLRSSDIVWGYLWEVILFSEMPNAYTILGALSILLAIVVVSMEKLRSLSKGNVPEKSGRGGSVNLAKISPAKMKTKVLEKIETRRQKKTVKGVKYDKLKRSDSSLMSLTSEGMDDIESGSESQSDKYANIDEDSVA